MAVTTKKLFPATSNATTTVFNNVGIQLNNQDDLDVYVTLSGGTRVLQLRQSTGSTAQSSHPQVNNTDGLYFPAVTAGTTLYNYTLSTDNNTITFNSALPQGAVVFCERRTRDADSTYTTFASGSTIRATDLNNSSTESNFTAQDGRNKALTIEGVLFRGDQPSTNFVTTDHIVNNTIVDADIASNAEIEVYKLKDGAANQVLVTQSDGTTTNWSSNLDLPGTLDVTGNVDLDSNLNVDGTTTLDSTTVDGVLDVNGSTTIDNVRIDGNEIDTTSGNLTIDSATGTTTVDDNLVVTGTANFSNATTTFNGSQVVTETASQTLTNKTLTTPVINDLSGTAVVTSGTSTSDNKIYSAKRSDELYYRKGTADDIEESGVPWSGNDSTVATTAAIDARIIDLVEEVGGFVPIANETSFPTANPDINNANNKKGGTIVSVQTASTALPNGSTATLNGTTLTISNGRGSGNAVIITGVSATIPSGFGFLVETTSTDHTYAFHRLVPKATEVTTVAGKATEVTTVHNNITQVQTIHNNITDIQNVAADATDIGTVAAKATEIGRLGTADAVADMAILGTADVVADMAILGTNDVVADLNTLGTADVVADMNMLAVSDVISDMNDLATSGNITAMSNCSGSITNINTVASNLGTVNDFAARYDSGPNNPINNLDTGDLFFNTTSNSLKVYTGSAWVDGVTTTGNFALKTGNTFTGSNIHNDNVKSFYGTGSDLKIYHDGTVSRVQDDVNHLYLKGVNITLFQGNTAEKFIDCTSNNSVDLYYDNSKKFETTSTGGFVTGRLDIGNSSWAYPKTLNVQGSSGAILALRNNDTTSYAADTNTSIEFALNTGNTGNQTGSCEIRAVKTNGTNGNNERHFSFYTGVNGGSPNERLRITSGGSLNITNDSAKLQLGDSQDLQLYHSNSSYIDNTTGSLILRNNVGGGTSAIQIQAKATESSILAYPDGAVELYNNNSKKFETTSGGVLATGDFDSTTGIFERTTGFTSQLKFTDSNETKLVHGSNGQVKLSFVGTANAARGSIDGQSGFIRMITATGDTGVICRDNSSTDLRFDDSTKLETTSSGVTVTGSITATGGGLTTNGDVQFNSGTTNMNILFDASQQSLEFDDSVKATFGFDRDLQIYHNGTDSYIDEAGTGRLLLRTSQLAARRYDNNNDLFTATAGGSVDLYYNGSKKLNTTSTGVALHGLSNGTGNSTLYYNSSTGQVLYGATPATDLVTDTSPELGGNLDAGTRNIEFDDNGKLRFGTGNDFEIYHKSADNGNYIESQNSRNLFLEQDQIFILNEAGNEYMIHGVANGAVSLYYNNSKKLETDNSGVTIGGTTAERLKIDGSVGDCILASSGAEIQFTRDSQNNITCTGASSSFRINGNSKVMANFVSNGAAELYHNNSKKLETTSDGIDVDGSITCNDLVTAGAVLHENDTNTLIHFDAADEIAFKTGGTTRMRVHNSLVRMYRNTVPDANNTYDLGSTSLRWRNIYTNDLNLSNKGSSNDVDGTWGDWTIQEGESDLFLKNNRSGKKYKFNLMEVS